MILFDLGGNKIGFFELERFFKLTIFWKLFDISEVIGNLFYFDEETEGMLKIGSNDLTSDLFANFIDNYLIVLKNINFYYFL